jgi:undecaprenyl-diphosphatase
MSLFEAIVLGIVQGLTEFLPISSTGHLRIVPALVGWDDPGAAFTAVIQMGTTVAVLIYFRRDLWRIALAWLGSLRGQARGRRPEDNLDARLGWYIVLGTIPIAIFGLIFKDQIENGARDLYLIGTALIVFGLVMLAADRTATQRRDIDSIDARDGAFVGVAQALALVPGVSRSGATISAGLFRGLNREAAARYSFLLATPAIVLSALFELRKFIGGDETNASAGALIVSTVIAFFVGYWSISFLLRYLAHHSLSVFVAYRVALGVLVIALTAAGAIS